MHGTSDAGGASLLIVDDDKAFSTRLGRAMAARGYEVETADGAADGLSRIMARPPAFAVVDLRLGDGNGIDLVAGLRRARPDARAVVLTGYGNIASAVTAMRAGAFHYLAKPADADDVHAALAQGPAERPDIPENPMSADRVRWEHILRVYELCGHNTSDTARRLRMHRRTLQRIMSKRAPC